MTADLRREFALLLKIGEGLVAEGRHREALDTFHKGLALAQKLGGDASDDLRASHDTAFMLFKMAAEFEALGEVARAVEAYQRCCRIFERISDDPTNFEPLRDAYVQLGLLFINVGRAEDALAPFQKNLELHERYFAKYGENPLFDRSLISSAGRLADVFMMLSKFEEACSAFEHSLELINKIEEMGRADRDLHYDRHVILRSMAEAAGSAGHVEQALRLFQECRQMLEALVSMEPKNASVRDELSNVMFRIGDVLDGLGQRKEGFAIFWKSVQDAQDQLAREPNNREWLRNLGLAIGRFADRFARVGDQELATKHYFKSLRICEHLLEGTPAEIRLQTDLALVLLQLADVGNEPRARYSRALAILRQLASAGELSAKQLNWIPKVEARLAALPR